MTDINWIPSQPQPCADCAEGALKFDSEFEAVYSQLVTMLMQAGYERNSAGKEALQMMVDSVTAELGSDVWDEEIKRWLTEYGVEFRD